MRESVPRRDRLWNSVGQAAAFTLIEIMIVMGIMVLVLAMGAPSFVNLMKKEPLRQAVSDMMEGLGQARTRAIMQGVPAELVISPGEASAYHMRVEVISERLSSDPGQMEQPVSSLGIAPFTADIPSDVWIRFIDVNLSNRMDTGEARVRFFPNGTSYEFTTILESRAGAQRISLDSITGLADFEIVR